jgi:cytochrome c
LVLCFGGSAGAQERGKTLYTAQCETCHKSPQAVTTFHGGLDLKTFLGELHHADTPESAASIAAYLKELEQAAQSRANEPAKKRRRTKQRGGANPATINAASTDNDPLKQTMKMLFGGANSSNENH